MTTIRSSSREQCAEDIVVELTFATAAIRRAVILSRGEAVIAHDLARLLEAANATLHLAEIGGLAATQKEMWTLKS